MCRQANTYNVLSGISYLYILLSLIILFWIKLWLQIFYLCLYLQVRFSIIL